MTNQTAPSDDRLAMVRRFVEIGESLNALDESAVDNFAFDDVADRHERLIDERHSLWQEYLDRTQPCEARQTSWGQYRVPASAGGCRLEM